MMKGIKPNWTNGNYGTISVCMIAKNEEKRLARCLKSIQGLADEVILVDTGSTDKTIEIAKSFGCKIFLHLWQSDFALARNEASSHASCDWCFSIDPDEIIFQRDHDKIRALTRKGYFQGFLFHTRNYTKNPRMQSLIPARGEYSCEKGYVGYTQSTKTRLWRNGIDLKWIGVWHELLDYDIAKRGLRSITVSIPVHHFEHEFSQKSYAAKKWFYLRLAEKKVRQNPDDGKAWWELAIAEHILKLYARAIRSMKRALKTANPTPEMYFFLFSNLKKTGDEDQAKFEFQKATCMLFPMLTHIDPILKKKKF